jgi:hypothetical protein
MLSLLPLSSGAKTVRLGLLLPADTCLVLEAGQLLGHASLDRLDGSAAPADRELGGAANDCESEGARAYARQGDHRRTCAVARMTWPTHCCAQQAYERERQEHQDDDCDCKAPLEGIPDLAGTNRLRQPSLVSRPGRWVLWDSV